MLAGFAVYCTFSILRADRLDLILVWYVTLHGHRCYYGKPFPLPAFTDPPSLMTANIHVTWSCVLVHISTSTQLKQPVFITYFVCLDFLQN